MQNAQMPSASNVMFDSQSNLNFVTTDGWYSYFGGANPTTPVTTNFAATSTESINLLTQRPRDPVFTLPISVKPKTREPQAFTDNRIYVSNIPFSFREQDLAAMFHPYGRVLSVEIVTNDRGSKGFGFVTLDSIEACENARKHLHESHVQGRIIEVRRATPTRRKMSSGTTNEVLPPPKLCVDLRAPHSLWRSEPMESYQRQHPLYGYPNVFAENTALNRQTTRTPFGNHADFNGTNFKPQSSLFQHSQQPRKCLKHSDLKLSSNGDYFLKSGELTTDTSLLMCMHGHNSCQQNHQAPQEEVSKHDSTDSETNQIFPNHIRDQITALLDNSSHHHSMTSTAPKRADSVGSSGVRTSESETASDDDLSGWNPNSSPDLLASLYEGSTSFHGV